MIFGVFDFETTGLTVHPLAELDLQPRPIEFAALLTDGENIIDTFEFIINPGMAIEEIITKITGLTNEDLENQPVFSEFIPKLKDIFGRADACIAHNLSFDKSITNYALQREGLTLDDVNFPELQICTVEQTYHHFGRRMRLEELYNLLCGKYEQKHRALDDVLLLHEICKTIGVYNMWENK